MLYIKEEPAAADKKSKLLYYCKNCNFSTSEDEELLGKCIIDNNYTDDDTKYKQYVTDNVKYDPTLPRVNDIKCPNVSCTKKLSDEDEVIYLKYDFTNMKYVYFCAHCETFWKTN
jgi:hypothetical protein